MASNYEEQPRRVKAMKKHFLSLIAVIPLLLPAYSAAHLFRGSGRSFLISREVRRVVKPNDLVNYRIQGRGKKGRKYIRRFSLKDNLTGDKLRAYEAYGYTPHRLRFLTFSHETERWRYYSLGLELTFDEEGNLISTRRFPKESGHID